MGYRSNNNIVFSNKYHCIWCAKYRRNVLTDNVKDRLLELVRQVIADKKATLIEIEVMPDHVHILVEVDPQYGIHRLLKAIKGVTSRCLRKEFPTLKSRLPTLWTNSYFASSVGGAPLEVIKQYIENQTNK